MSILVSLLILVKLILFVSSGWINTMNNGVKSSCWIYFLFLFIFFSVNLAILVCLEYFFLARPTIFSFNFNFGDCAGRRELDGQPGPAAVGTPDTRVAAPDVQVSGRTDGRGRRDAVPLPLPVTLWSLDDQPVRTVARSGRHAGQRPRHLVDPRRRVRPGSGISLVFLPIVSNCELKFTR